MTAARYLPKPWLMLERLRPPQRQRERGLTVFDVPGKTCLRAQRQYPTIAFSSAGDAASLTGQLQAQIGNSPTAL